MYFRVKPVSISSMKMALNLIFPPSSTTILAPTRLKFHTQSSISSSKSNPDFSFHQLVGKKSPKFLSISRDYPPRKPLNLIICRDGTDDDNTFFDEDSFVLDFTDSSFEDMGSPWEGAIIYKRNASVSHLEYCTTLERLGMEAYSTEVSKSKASIMGLRVTKAVKDYPLGTPVQISIDVTRKKKKLRLDGLIKTVLSLDCLRCGEPAAKSLFLNLSLLLDEQPIEESDVIDLGDIFGKNKPKAKASRFNAEDEDGDVDDDDDDDDDDGDIDPDDHLYFPTEKKEIDISKSIRDLVHLQITINTLCDSGCKGICVQCGEDLNTSSCICSKEELEEENISSPFKDLIKLQMK